MADVAEGFPPWHNRVWMLPTLATGVRWARAMNALREAARQKAGKHREPSVAIIGARSVKSAEKGGIVVMVQARKPRGESSISR